MMLSKLISYEMAVSSPTAKRFGIENNVENIVVLNNMKHLSSEFLDLIFKEYKSKGVHILSFYRSYYLNKQIGGSKYSNHMQGSAVDISLVDKSKNYEVFEFILDLKKEFNQLLWEFGTKKSPQWIHLDAMRPGDNKLTLCYNEGYKKRYESFMTYKDMRNFIDNNQYIK